MENYFDTVVIGAGLSGIAAGYRMQTELPHYSYVILEGRDSIGGTWDLFKYPGIRSDSDMYTLGYSFSPWTDNKAIADGESILRYIKETAKKYNIEEHIRMNTMVRRMSWDSSTCLWTVETTRTGSNDTSDRILYTCRFLFVCTGYYDYDAGYSPIFTGSEQYKGIIVHPQHWPESLDYKDKRVIVIGSGATAVTLVPEMAKTAAHVTMLQRSPTYIGSMPSEDPVGNFLVKYLPHSIAHFLNRWKNILFGTLFYHICRTFPGTIKRLIVSGVKREVGRDCDAEKHFSPRYKPWDQRFCLVPDGDLFKAIKSKRASVVTATIDTFTERGVQVRDIDSPDAEAVELEADIVVTATGLNVKVGGGAEVYVDGERMDNWNKRFMYKGVMIGGVPNFVLSVGYTNLTFTLKVDLIGTYVCRLLKYMDRKGFRKCCPVYGNRKGESPQDEGEDLIDLSSGYIQRAIHLFPKQGRRSPWRYYQNYFADIFEFYFGRLEDGVMTYK